SPKGTNYIIEQIANKVKYKVNREGWKVNQKLNEDLHKVPMNGLKFKLFAYVDDLTMGEVQTGSTEKTFKDEPSKGRNFVKVEENDIIRILEFEVNMGISEEKSLGENYNKDQKNVQI
ncbi:2238_t:CDS:2, partial [Gigaspora rosea]